MVDKKFVVAIPPSYFVESLETESTSEYVKYLHAHGATTVMTTAGTSQFNLLSTQEIHQLNQSIVDNFDGVSILGVPGCGTKDACNFVEDTKQYRKHNTHVMALYPDRFYDKATVIDHVSRISDAWGGPVYLHTPKMRKGTGGDWDYTAEIVNELYYKDKLAGIKEEHSDLSASYNFVAALNKRIDVIVAGGSMRRFNYLESAGANAFLSGIGNLFPEIETKFLNSVSDWRELFLRRETVFFNTFLKYGWHASLRSALKLLELTCFNNRSPWPELSPDAESEIMNIIKELKDAG